MHSKFKEVVSAESFWRGRAEWLEEYYYASMWHFTWTFEQPRGPAHANYILIFFSLYLYFCTLLSRLSYRTYSVCLIFFWHWQAGAPSASDLLRNQDVTSVIALLAKPSQRPQGLRSGRKLICQTVILQIWSWPSSDKKYNVKARVTPVQGRRCV